MPGAARAAHCLHRASLWTRIEKGKTTMRTSYSSVASRVTLSDVVAAVSRIAKNEREVAAVVNHMLRTAHIKFANPMTRGRLQIQ